MPSFSKLDTLGYPSLNSFIKNNSAVKPIVSLTFPKEILAKIDYSRGDIPRSRYILRLIEKAYNDKDDIHRQDKGQN